MNIKLAWRLARLFVHLFAGLAACALVFPWAGPGRREGVTRRWSRQLLRIGGVSVEQTGATEALARAMIVANHVSWLDVWLILSVHPVRFVAKSDIAGWPLAGWLVRQAGTIFIERARRSDTARINRTIEEVMQRPEAVQGGLRRAAVAIGRRQCRRPPDPKRPAEPANGREGLRAGCLRPLQW